MAVPPMNALAAFRAAGVPDPDDAFFGKVHAQCTMTLQKMQSIADALVASVEWYIFVSVLRLPERPQYEAVWAFADDLALVAPPTQDWREDLTVAIYKPSRDFQKVEVTATNAVGPDFYSDSRLIVTATGPDQKALTLNASSHNCRQLYGALPYLLGRPPKPASEATS